MKETLEDAANNYSKGIIEPQVKTIHYVAFKDGAEWQAEKMYSDMQEYAEYSMECLVLGEDCLFAKEWFKQFKKK